MLAFRQASISIYRAKKRDRVRQTKRERERETHSGDAYIFTDVDGYCVCVCDAMLSLHGIVYGLEAMDYRLQTIAHRL